MRLPIKKIMASSLHLSGAGHILRKWGSTDLTVINHHRVVDDVFSTEFSGLRSLVSASAEMFERQLVHIKRHHNVIEGSDVVAFVRGQQKLPPRACLVTFDDGYLDNYTVAAPLLIKHDIPAVIFLASSRMDQPSEPLWWDITANIVRHTEKQQAELPLVGLQDFSTALQRDHTCELLTAQMKRLSESDRSEVLKSLSNILGTPDANETPYFMDWKQVRSLHGSRIEFHPHTVTHPILSQVSSRQVKFELSESKRVVEKETNAEATLFAYPNGTSRDYNSDTVEALNKCGYTAAFTLAPGPQSLAETTATPFEIRRVYLSHKDSWHEFRLKLDGFPRALASIKRK